MAKLTHLTISRNWVKLRVACGTPVIMKNGFHIFFINAKALKNRKIEYWTFHNASSRIIQCAFVGFNI